MLPAIWHRYIFLFGIIGLASGMLFGTAPTSIPQIIIAVNWVLETNFSFKWRLLKTNVFFWILSSFFLLHLVGLLYTSNIEWGLQDIRNKFPLLVLPILFFSTKPLSSKELKWLFSFFYLSVVVSSIYCFIVYLGYTKKTITDPRQASVFMSHIRFSLFIAFAIIGLGYRFFTNQSMVLKTICVLGISWLLFFMFRLELATGFFCLMIVCFFLFVWWAFVSINKTTITLLLFIVLFGLSSLLFLNLIKSFDMFDKNTASKNNTMLQKTANGRSYLQDTIFQLAENGNLITININDEEINKEWTLRSAIPYNHADSKGNNVRYTILRYLASKGLTKDSTGIVSLTKDDVSNIERGYTNYKYTSSGGLIGRWRELVWEYTKYKRGENPSGHTLTMRLEFWKTACYIIKQNPLFGVGTGDIQDSFNEAYVETHSKLDKHWWLRCHNQYLAITVAFGFVGLIIFLCYLFYPAIKLNVKLHPLYWSFLLIALLSFFTEDTLETQSGVTFFIFFQTLFLWLASFKSSLTTDTKSIIT